MDNAVAVYEQQPLTAIQLREQVNLIQDVMKGVMRENEHYGKIPGCGDKPSLLKPGAEKLMFTFRLVADPEVEVHDLYHPSVQGHREYRVKVKIYSNGGVYLGGGVGSCSTMESKYRYRGGEKMPTDTQVPINYWNLKKEGRTEDAKALIGGDGYGVAKIDGKWVVCEIGEKMEHDNPADFYNTCEKMAKKRALVDATLTVTAASDIFTQDIEELVDNGVMTPTPKKEGNKPPLTQPGKKSDKPAPKTTDGDIISETQRKRFYAIYKNAGKTDDEVKEYLFMNYNIEHSTDIPRDKYEEICNWAETTKEREPGSTDD